jgi:uncharacterized protein YkwD
MHQTIRIALAVVLAALTLISGQPAASAAALDQPIAGGRFYSQTAGRDGQAGYRVTNEGGVRLWDEFQRLGGVDALGYPISRRFTWKGFTVQAMQKGVLQWRPEAGQAWLTNVFDELHEADKDAWLQASRSTPRPLDPSFDGGRDWVGVVRGRQALLEASPALKGAYFAAADPLTFFGLPTSKVEDMGSHYAVRLQRAVIQQWKVDVPWAKAGQVTVANGADIAREAGLFPAEVTRPETPAGADAPGGAQASARSSASPAAAARPPAPAIAPPGGERGAQAAVDRVNHYRALMGLPPLRLDEALTRAASAHAAYYRQNGGNGAMAGMGLHRQTPGRPGFTGEEWGARARAAGWRGGSVDENVGLVGDGARAVDAFMATVNHRWNLLHPSAVALGYGSDAERPIDVFNIGFATDASLDRPAVYPGPDQRGVPTSSGLWETPDPAPGVARPVGYPLTATFPLRAQVAWEQPTLVDAAGQPVDVAVSTKSWLRGQAIIPKAPLRAGTTYRATVRGKVGGRAFEYSWSFATG